MFPYFSTWPAALSGGRGEGGGRKFFSYRGPNPLSASLEIGMFLSHNAQLQNLVPTNDVF